MNYPGRVIKKGESDKTIVKAIQRRLNELGIPNVTIDGDFGNDTLRAVKLFQARNSDNNGNPLVIDGIIGAISWEALFRSQLVIVPHITPYIAAVMDTARSQVGVMEVPLFSNGGPEVDEYLRSVGLGTGYAWCMAFVYWCFQKAAERTGGTNPLVRTAGCLDQWNSTKLRKISKNDAVNNPALIFPGSVFIMDFGRGMGHTGIVESVNNGFINTIEGNTNTANSRAGIGVFKTTRKINSISKGFIMP